MGEMLLNTIYNECCLSTMGKMPDGFIDLVVTSPPYDNLREYKGYSFDFESIAKELFRVTKTGGVVVWVVSDATKDGTESLTSFKQALFFKECGFSVETMIWAKEGVGAVGSNNLYWQAFEYMFVLIKGVQPKTHNPIKDKRNLSYGQDKSGVGRRRADGTLKEETRTISGAFAKRNNWWVIPVGKVSECGNHPAIFPEKLAADHIYTWSNEGDLVFDCFAGSGTTLKMAHLQKRNWIGSEISKEYCELAEKRLAPYLAQTSLF